MKRLVVFLAVFLFLGGALAVSAQDLIILKDGSVIEAKVTEISPSEIRYKRSDHLDGPTIVVPAVNVLSIRYANGKVDVINANPTAGAPAGSLPGITSAVVDAAMDVAGAMGTTPQLGLPPALQSILNSMPAIPIAGNNLKFDFSGESWTARLNGDNFSTGTIEFEATAAGGILTLRQTHIWPGAAGKAAGRVVSMIPGAGAVGGALNAAGSVAGALGPIEASGTIALEYKAGPPARLRAMSKSEQAAAGIKSAAGIQSASAIVLSDDDWWINQGPGCITQSRVNSETIDGQEVDVLAVEVTVVNMGWAGVQNNNNAIVEKLRSATGIRFKALGDGKSWQLIIYMPETFDGGTHRAEIRTRKGKVVEINIPYSRLRQPEWGKRVKFDKDRINGIGIERGSHQGLGATTIKVFDIEVY